MIKAFIISAMLLSAYGSFAQQLKGAWYSWNPYQSLDDNRKLTGLDYELISKIFEESGIEVKFDESDNDSWDKNQQDVRNGGKDFTGGAFMTEFRKENYFVSKPYRFEWNSIYCGRSDKEIARIDKLDDLLDYIEKHKIKLGAIEGYKYTSVKINRFIEKQLKEGGECLAIAKTEEQNFKNFMSGKVRLVISDRLVGARVLWDNDWGEEIQEHQIILPKKPIHLLLHKPADSLKRIAYSRYIDQFNIGLDRLTERGEIDQMIKKHLFPVLMNITVQTDWFFIIDLIGILFFAITGLLLSYDLKLDVFGVILLTLLFCAGGGIVRDLLVNRPLSLMTSPIIMQVILGISILGFALLRIHLWLSRKYESYRKSTLRSEAGFNTVRIVIEAMALGAYTIVGVGVAVEMKLEPLGIWGPFLGCVTSCGGGILANCLIVRKNPILMGTADPEVSIFWGIFFSQFLIWQTDRLNPHEVFIGVIITMIGSTSFIVLSAWRKWKSPIIRK
ncbi:TRIC cation channel family protein [Fluviicola taffensis]|uniref:TRIC cation channel family protein n=1 Tax=Fluviicola taffensis TaxID=191579 RepID=UPI003137EFE4